MAADNTRKTAEEVRGLDRIVNDVLVFAREIHPRPQRQAVCTLFERVIAAHRPAIEDAQVSVHASDDEMTITADAELAHQALLNVLRNAVDAVAPGTGEVWLDARREDGQVVLAVRDNGPGIDDEHVDRIFNPFFTTRNTGTGLGLAIVHRIVDAHGGAITVRNEGGAIFELRLPAYGAAAGDEVEEMVAAGSGGGPELESVGVG
jgi:two-component system sensor histidine kinase HydH